MSNLPVCIAIEDVLSEAVMRRILASFNNKFFVSNVLLQGGFGYLRRIAPGLNTASRGMTYIMLTDLDRSSCPVALRDDWLGAPKEPNFLFRVAVREVESWLLADSDELARFLATSHAYLRTAMPDLVEDPKQMIVEAARKSRKRTIREGVASPKGGTAKQGPDYNGLLTIFVDTQWSPSRAATNSESLSRALRELEMYVPVFE